jgi:hypothetical protein
VDKFISMVRLALVTSVACCPVRRSISHVSTVPKWISPASARARSPGTLSSSQTILGAEKYVARGSPLRSRNRSGPPSPARSRMMPSVRVSCQTIAGCTGSPVAASHMIVVSRWLVMPMAETSARDSPARSSAPWVTACT